MNWPDIDAVKAPPHSIEAEQAVIGALLLKSSAYDQIDWLSSSDFYSARHRLIYGAIRRMLEAGLALDTLLLSHRMQDDGELDQAGGMAYIGEIVVNTPSAANIKRYAEIVRSRSLLRGLQTLATDLADQAFEPGAIPSDLAELAESRLNDLRHGVDDSEPLPFHFSLDAALRARSQPDTGVHTGLIDLDRQLKPLRGGQLIIIAGRSGMGKSALAAGIGEHVANTLPVGLWSLEMSRAALAERILGWHERNDDMAASKLSLLQLHIDCPHVLTIGSLRLRAKRLRRRHGLKLAIVDYLGLMRGTGENRTQEIGSISRGLKGLAVELDIPIIAVAQLNRQNEQRTDKRPMLADLRESGDIEQDADIVLMNYRDDYYNSCSAARGTVEILIRKNREGPTGMVRCTWVGEHTRFLSYAGPPIDAPMNDPAPGIRKRRQTPDFRAAQVGPDP